MITKITSDNYSVYQELFNRADMVLNDLTVDSEFTQIDYTTDTYDSTLAYFNSNYQLLSAEDAEDAFDEATATIYKIRERVIYDLDTYYSNLETLITKDWSFLMTPVDEPTFDIIDDSTGRRVISVPSDFEKNGISVQGDEMAETLFFSIDRYYDTIDLWDADMQYKIQWETSNGVKGVTEALKGSDNKPFLDGSGKLYFGWPISSEITEEAGNVTFTVRIFKLDGTIVDDEPVLAFGLNTQPATVKINSSLVFKLTTTGAFEDAISLNKTSAVVSRIKNSTVYSKDTTETAEEPIIVSDIIDITGKTPQNVQVTTYTLASGDYDSEKDYYILQDDGSYEEADPQPTEVLYNKLKGIYYVEETKTVPYYSFDLSELSEETLQILATAPGVITYTVKTRADKEGSVGGNCSQAVLDSDIFLPVTSATREEDHRYYEYNENQSKYILATPTVASGVAWGAGDKNEAQTACKYYERYSPKITINGVGAYWIEATNHDGKKIASTKDSIRIFVPGPTALTEAGVTALPTEQFTEGDITKARIRLGTPKTATLDITATTYTSGDTPVYKWYEKNTSSTDDAVLISGATTGTYTFDKTDLTETQLALLDKTIVGKAHTERNGDSTVSSAISRIFRITDVAHKYQFDLTPDADEVNPRDNIKSIEYQADEDAIINDASDEDSIKIAELLDSTKVNNIASDYILYRWRKRVGDDDDVDHIYVNDIAVIDTTDVNKDHFSQADDIASIPVFKIDNTAGYGNQGYRYYCEIINVVNENFDIDALNASAEDMAEDPTNDGYKTTWFNTYEDRISRTPYFIKYND